jgi:hypothetical protein
MLDLAEIAANQRVLHRFMNEVDIEQPGLGDDRVAAIEDADLHPLPRRDVLDESDADLLEAGRPEGTCPPAPIA